MSIDIRRATASDLDQIVLWQVAMALETENLALDLSVVRKGVKHVFDEPAIGYYLIAQIDDKPVGCCLVLSEWSDWRAGYVLWIHSVFVMVEYRQRGVFRSLYQHLKAQIKSNSNFRGLRLYVDKSNAVARKAYETLGMDGDHYQMFEWMI